MRTGYPYILSVQVIGQIIRASYQKG